MVITASCSLPTTYAFFFTMKQFLLALVFTLLGGCILVVPANAASFPWFKIDQYEGWIETTPDGQSTIKLLPFVVPPGGPWWRDTSNPFGTFQAGPGVAPIAQGLDITADYRIKLGFKVISSPKYIMPNLKTRIEQKLNLPRRSLSGHRFEFVKVNKLRVTLVVGGKPRLRKTYGANVIQGDITSAFYVDTDNYEWLNFIERGDFNFDIDYNFPYNSFSSIAITVNRQLINRAMVTAFKEIVKTVRKSGGSFLFFDWSSKIQRVYVKENLNFQSENRLFESTSVVMRDPTPEQRERFNQLLGWTQTSANQVIEWHRQAYTNALAANKLTLAQAHKEYLEQLEAPDPESMGNDFLEKLAALAEDEVLNFLAAGLKVSESSASSYYRYNGTATLNVNTTVNSQYREFIISSTQLSFEGKSYQPNNYKLPLQSAYEKLNYTIFGKGAYYEIWARDWARGVAGRIRMQDLQAVRYCFRKDFALMGRGGANPNLPLDEDENTSLHLAAASGQRDMVAFLMKQGANPRRFNRFRETPLELARENEHWAVVSLLRSRYNEQGQAHITVSTPEGMILKGIDVSQPLYKTKVETVKVNDQKIRMEIRGFPGKFYTSLYVKLRISVSHADYPRIQFPHQRVGYNNNTIVIDVGCFVFKPYKIKDGQVVNYSERIVFAGFDKGFVAQ